MVIGFTRDEMVDLMQMIEAFEKRKSEIVDALDASDYDIVGSFELLDLMEDQLSSLKDKLYREFSQQDQGKETL